MKSYLLPLAAVTGALITLGLTAVTLAAPADKSESPAAAQVRELEYQSRMREWSQGLGIDPTGRGATVAQSEPERDVSAISKPASGIAASEKPAKDHAARRDRDRRDRSGDRGHEDDDADESHS